MFEGSTVDSSSNNRGSKVVPASRAGLPPDKQSLISEAANAGRTGTDMGNQCPRVMRRNSSDATVSDGAREGQEERGTDRGSKRRWKKLRMQVNRISSKRSDDSDLSPCAEVTSFGAAVAMSDCTASELDATTQKATTDGNVRVSEHPTTTTSQQSQTHKHHSTVNGDRSAANGASLSRTSDAMIADPYQTAVMPTKWRSLSDVTLKPGTSISDTEHETHAVSSVTWWSAEDLRSPDVTVSTNNSRFYVDIRSSSSVNQHQLAAVRSDAPVEDGNNNRDEHGGDGKDNDSVGALKQLTAEQKRKRKLLQKMLIKSKSWSANIRDAAGPSLSTVPQKVSPPTSPPAARVGRHRRTFSDGVVRSRSFLQRLLMKKNAEVDENAKDVSQPLMVGSVEPLLEPEITTSETTPTTPPTPNTRRATKLHGLFGLASRWRSLTDLSTSSSQDASEPTRLFHRGSKKLSKSKVKAAGDDSQSGSTAGKHEHPITGRKDSTSDKKVSKPEQQQQQQQVTNKPDSDNKAGKAGSITEDVYATPYTGPVSTPKTKPRAPYIRPTYKIHGSANVKPEPPKQPKMLNRSRTVAHIETQSKQHVPNFIQRIFRMKSATPVELPAAPSAALLSVPQASGLQRTESMPRLNAAAQPAELQTARQLSETTEELKTDSLPLGRLNQSASLSDLKVINQVAPAVTAQRVQRRRFSLQPKHAEGGAMFGRKTHGDVKKSTFKVLDIKKEPTQRLKHLRVVLDTYETHEAKNFFNKNYSHIYYIFHDVFTSVEADLRQRATKSHREELDGVLYIFEKILMLLPELIHKRWQYHSIGHIMKKLLHTGNALKLRREGMRLFIIWYQILMDNATDECHHTYAGLVPDLGSTSDLDVDSFTVKTLPEGAISSAEILPLLLPQSGDKQPECLTKWLLETLLTYMVSEVTKIEWTNGEKHESCFNFLFNKFKHHYLHSIFPNFKYDTSIYIPCLDLPPVRKLDSVQGPDRPQVTALCQEVLVKWMATFAHRIKKVDVRTAGSTANNPPAPPPPPPPPASSGGQPVPPSSSGGETTGQAVSDVTAARSNTSTMSSGSCAELGSAGSVGSAGSNGGAEEQTACEYAIVQRVLYSTRENINVVQEVFRQACLFPFHQSSAIRRVINVYKYWFLDENRPVFIQEPVTTRDPKTCMLSPDGISAVDGSSPPAASCEHPVAPSDVASEPSSTAASTALQAGLQNTLQLFITHSSNLFLLEQSQESLILNEQVDICKRVLNIYRHTVMNHHMQHRTWEQLLLALLHITSGVLSVSVPEDRHHCLGGRLAQPIFQTLIVTWIKANLNVFISEQLWDHFLRVLSSLTAWLELIKEWADTMETLTRVLARHVYDLDLNDMPLDRLSEQKEKRRRRIRPSFSHDGHMKRTFSRGWSRHEQVENLRLQLKRQVDTATGLPAMSATQPTVPAAATLRHPLASSSSSSGAGGDTSGGSGLVRVRSRSGHASPAQASCTLNPSTAVPTLVRSNSDSSIMVDVDRTAIDEQASRPQAMDDMLADIMIKKEGGDSLVDEVMECVYFSTSEYLDEDSLAADSITGESMDTNVADQVAEPTELVAVDSLGVDESVTGHSLTSDSYVNGSDDAHMTAMLDNLSVNSTDSGQLPYQLLDQSTDSNSNSISFDKGSYGEERSDTEVLLTISDTSSQCDSVELRRRHASSSSSRSFSCRSSAERHCSSTADRMSLDGVQAGRTSGDRSSGDRSSGDRMLGDRSSGDRMLGDRSSSERTARDRTSGNRIPAHRTSRHRTSSSASTDDISGDRTSADASSADGLSTDDPSIGGTSVDFVTSNRTSEDRKLVIDNVTSANSLVAETASVDEVTLDNSGEKYPESVHQMESFKQSLTSDVLQNAHTESEEMTGGSTHQLSPTRAADHRCVLAGGPHVGWTATVAVVIWRRMLGALGDVNRIVDPAMHAHVYECLCQLVCTLIKMRDNLAISKDNQVSPPPPQRIPPLLMFTPWFFQAVQLPAEYKRGKLLAYRLLCAVTMRPADVPLSPEYLSRFYHVLHHGLVHEDQDSTNTLVKHCGPRFFSLPLRGATMMTLDFIHAANTIAASTDLKQAAPRSQAMSILGCLLCFPNHFGPLSVLQPKAIEMTIMQCTDIKDHIVNILLKSGKKEPDGLARCIAISSLGIFLHEELSHGGTHPKLREAISSLLSTLKFKNKSVALVATHMLLLLAEHVEVLLEHDPEVPTKIIETIANTISSLLPSTEHSNSQEDKRLLVSIMFCLLEWCTRVPLQPYLLDTASGGHKSLLYKTFKVLHQVLTGSGGQLTPRSSCAAMHVPPAAIASETESEDGVENVRETSHAPASADTLDRQSAAPAGRSDMLKLAASTVMVQLVNQLGHFPMAGGAAQLHGAVQESDDADDTRTAELTADIFNAPNVQFFVLNGSTLISFVEIPALLDVPGGGVTAGLTTAKTLTRALIRDSAGKFCWDSAVLYGPPKCRAGSFPAEPVVVDIFEDLSDVGVEISEAESQSSIHHHHHHRAPHEVPMYVESADNCDNLDDMLQYIGTTSTECQLRPGVSLNVPFDAPDELSPATETATIDAVLIQHDSERDYVRENGRDDSMLATRLVPVENRDPTSAFQLCRLFLNQFGFLQWGKRSQFDLLKKSDKLLRELKHLDGLKCRETYKLAVLYVAVGQEDKQSILMNSGGSPEYENFVASLGWEVELESHRGFMGGLSHTRTTGVTAPYYATATTEVIFHVATRMPSERAEDMHKKVIHLGNDEVQVVWSEHTRDYRRGIIATDFGDVIIVIYPLHNGLYRIQIIRKPEVPYFGPLFDGVIVDGRILPSLVRVTALNASHVLRSLSPFFKPFYEERARCVQNIVQQHRQPSTFEEFASLVFAPIIQQQQQQQQQQRGGENAASSQVEPPSGEVKQLPEKNEADEEKGNRQTKTGEALNDPSNMFTRRLSFGKSKKSVTKQVLAQQLQQQLQQQQQQLQQQQQPEEEQLNGTSGVAATANVSKNKR